MFGGYLVAAILATIIYPFFWRAFSLYIPYASVTNEKPLYFYPNVNAFSLDSSFYQIVTFSIFFFLLCLLVRFIGVFLNDFKDVTDLENEKFYNGLMGFFSVMFVLYLIVSAAAMIPMKGIQATLQSSFLAHIIINGPYSWVFGQLWF